MNRHRSIVATVAGPRTRRQLLVVVVVALVVPGCARRRAGTETAGFDLAVHLSAPLGSSAQASLPAELTLLALPVKVPACEEVLFYPNVLVFRDDVAGSKPVALTPKKAAERYQMAVELDRKTAGGGFRGFLHAEIDAATLEKAARTEVEGKTMGPELTVPGNAAPQSLAAWMTTYKDSPSVSLLQPDEAVVDALRAGLEGAASEGRKPSVYSDPTQLVAALASEACARRNASSAAGGATPPRPAIGGAFLVLYPGAVFSPPGATPPPAPLPGGATATAPPGVSREALALLHDVYSDGEMNSSEEAAVTTALGGLPADEQRRAEQDVKERWSRARPYLKDGLAAVQAKRFAEAAKHLRMASQEDPENAWVLANLAAAENRLGDVARAQSSCRQALDADPSNWLAHYSSAGVNLTAGRREESLGELEKALTACRTNPRSGMSPENLARLIREDDQFSGLRAEPRFRTLVGAR